MNTLKLKPLHYEAIKLADKAPDIEDIRKRDVTQVFYIELQQRIQKGNLINVNVRGEQTSGKSLVGFTLAKYVNINLLKKPMNISKIATDQIEFLEKIRDMKVGDTCLVIDEWNELSTTGYNATTSQALLTQFCEVQAQRFVHKFACSPQKIIDPTCSIILDVLDKDVKRKTTRCMCYYVLHHQGMRIEQAVGFVDIDVSKSINDKTWLAYRKRKFERMNMLMEKGIVDSRKADDSKIILKVIDKLYNMAVVNGLVNKDIIRSFIQVVQDRYNPISIYGEDKLVGSIYGTLVLLKTVSGLNGRIHKINKTIEKLSMEVGNEKSIQQYIKAVDNLKTSKADILDKYELTMRNHEEVIEVVKRFAEHDESKIKDGEKEFRGGVL